MLVFALFILPSDVHTMIEFAGSKRLLVKFVANSKKKLYIDGKVQLCHLYIALTHYARCVDDKHVKFF